MIDPAMNSALGAFTGAAASHTVNSAMETVPTWIKVSALGVGIGAITWWYLLATEKHKNKVRRATSKAK